MTAPTQPEIPPPSLDDVLYRRDGDIAWIMLNRPVVLNAVNWSILRQLKVALDQAETDVEVRAVVLHGAGRVFCAGGDLQSTRPNDDLPTPSGVDVCMQIWHMAKPVIAAVQGYAVGQGCELAGICDMTVAAEDARFGEIQIRHGFGPPVLITPYLLGPKQAKELMLLGELVDAAEARRLGLVNRIVPAERLLAEAEAMARRCASLNPRTVQSNKLLINRVHELAGFREAIDYRSDAAFGPLTQPGGSRESPDEHLGILRERGWEAFRASRDATYREADARGS